MKLSELFKDGFGDDIILDDDAHYYTKIKSRYIGNGYSNDDELDFQVTEVVIKLSNDDD